MSGEKLEVKKILGEMKCYNCGEPVAVKNNIKNHAYFNCSWGDGGCGCQFQSRTNDADRHIFDKMNRVDQVEPNTETKEKTADLLAAVL